MWDRAVCPAVSPAPADAFGFYIPSPGAFHVWTPAEIQRGASWCQLALPISVWWTGHNGAALAQQNLVYAEQLGLQVGDSIVLDVEHSVAAEARADAHAWADRVRAARRTPIVYCSLTDAEHFADVADLWVAHWTNVAHLEPGSVATQYRSPTSDSSTYVDWSLVADGLQLWSPHGVPVPKPATPKDRPMMILVSREHGTVYQQFADGSIHPLEQGDDAAAKADADALIAALPHATVSAAYLTSLKPHQP